MIYCFETLCTFLFFEENMFGDGGPAEYGNIELMITFMIPSDIAYLGHKDALFPDVASNDNKYGAIKPPL
jgi:hypothetical protein